MNQQIIVKYIEDEAKISKKYIKGIKGEFTLTDFMQKAGRFIRFEVFLLA